MGIEVHCERCGHTYSVPDTRAGQVGKCRCGNQIVVPELAPAAPAPAPGAPEALLVEEEASPWQAATAPPGGAVAAEGQVLCGQCGMSSRPGLTCEWCSKPLVTAPSRPAAPAMAPARRDAVARPSAGGRGGTPIVVKVVAAAVAVGALGAGAYFLVLPRLGLGAAAGGGGQAASYADGKVQSARKTELKSLFLGVAQGAVVGDQAISQLQQALRKDSRNANLYYLMAWAYAEKGDAAEAVKYLKQGNQQRDCYLYVTETGAQRLMINLPHFARDRDLARHISAAAPSLGPQAGAEALKEVRAMGAKLMEEQPRSLMIALLVGAAARAIADKALVQLYQQAGMSQEAQQAANLQAADRNWADSIKAQAKGLVSQSATVVTELQGLGVNMDSANFNLDTLPPESRQKLDEAWDKMAKEEAEFVDRALKTRPS